MHLSDSVLTRGSTEPVTGSPLQVHDLTVYRIKKKIFLYPLVVLLPQEDLGSDVGHRPNAIQVAGKVR